MRLDRLAGDVERFGDLTVLIPLHERFENAKFAGRARPAQSPAAGSCARGRTATCPRHGRGLFAVQQSAIR